jgi:hypothetical protein
MGMSDPAEAVVAMAGEGEAERYSGPRAGNLGVHRKARLIYTPFSYGLDEIAL